MFKRTIVNLLLVLAMLLTVGVSAVSGAPPAQEEMTYTVKLGDNLWTLAEKYLGSGPAYWAIVGATNARYAADPSFAFIENPSLIHPGWKLLIPGAEEAAEYATPPEPKRGGTFTVGVTGDIVDFNAYLLSFFNYPTQIQLWDRLIIYDANLDPIPRLAESWELSDDGLTLTFNLRQDVKWHNGREFVADDVVANFERAMVKETGGSIYGKIQSVESVEAPDDYTVVIRYKAPDPAMFDAFSVFSMMAPESFDEVKSNAIGTGPFKLQEWIPGDHVTLVRNDDYWAEGLPYLDEVILKPYTDQEALISALEAGLIDAGIDVPFKFYDRVQAAGLRSNFGTEGNLIWNLLIRPLPPDPDEPLGPLSNKLVRQAINYAVDRETMVDQAMYGVGKATVLPFPRQSLAYFEEYADYYTFDLDKARELLEEAGVTWDNQGTALWEGEPIVWEAITQVPRPPTTDSAQILKADLNELGINLEIVPLDFSVFRTRHLGTAENPCSTYELNFTAAGRMNLDPMGLFDNTPYRIVGSPTFCYEPYPDYWEEYVEHVKAAGSTVDIDERKAHFKAIQEIMLDESWQIPTSWYSVVFAYQPYVKGLEVSQNNEIMLRSAWLDK